MTAHLVQLPARELVWLRKYDRSLAVPEIVYAEIGERGGYYAMPRPGKIRVIDGLAVDASRGIIVVNSLSPAELHASTIAHEWRHHWQRDKGWPDEASVWADTPGETYEDRIVEYLRRHRHERDAVNFEHMVSPTWVTDYWLDLFHKAEASNEQ